MVIAGSSVLGGPRAPTSGSRSPTCQAASLARIADLRACDQCASAPVGVTAVADQVPAASLASLSSLLAGVIGGFTTSPSSRRYGTLTTTVCGRPRRAVRSDFADWL